MRVTVLPNTTVRQNRAEVSDHNTLVGGRLSPEEGLPHTHTWGAENWSQRRIHC